MIKKLSKDWADDVDEDIKKAGKDDLKRMVRSELHEIDEEKQMERWTWYSSIFVAICLVAIGVVVGLVIAPYTKACIEVL